PAGKALKPKPANLVAMAGGHSDGDYAWKIENGRGPMPGWKSALTQNQIWDVVNYVQSLGGSKTKAK
ncbi:MAG: cytochrome c, partial [Gammaproteobacteria bacterium]|nr:cytochrome c [Gammaproteobacteria bacterium]